MYTLIIVRFYLKIYYFNFGVFMLSPKRTKFRKYHRGKMRGKVLL